MDWPPRAITIRVLEADGTEVHSEIQGESGSLGCGPSTAATRRAGARWRVTRSRKWGEGVSESDSIASAFRPIGAAPLEAALWPRISEAAL